MTMTATNPTMYYEKKIHLVAGPIEPHNLQIGAAVAASESFVAGALVSQNDDGEIIKGCADDKMPLWAINGTADKDVAVEGSAYGGGQNIGGGNVNCYVAEGGFELYTTEYDSATANEYIPGKTKLAPGSSSNIGKVVPASANYSDHLVCGTVSRGVDTDEYGTSVLYFWPCNQPPVLLTALTA